MFLLVLMIRFSLEVQQGRVLLTTAIFSLPLLALLASNSGIKITILASMKLVAHLILTPVAMYLSRVELTEVLVISLALNSMAALGGFN